MKPTLCRNVIYTDEYRRQYAAIITAVADRTSEDPLSKSAIEEQRYEVSIVYFVPSFCGTASVMSACPLFVPEQGAEGTWTWPPRV